MHNLLLKLFQNKRNHVNKYIGEGNIDLDNMHSSPCGKENDSVACIKFKILVVCEDTFLFQETKSVSYQSNNLRTIVMLDFELLIYFSIKNSGYRPNIPSAVFTATA